MRNMLLKLVVAVGAACAVTASGGPAERFPIDLDALRAEAAERFSAADADGDGALSADEFANVDLRQLMDDRGLRPRGSETGMPSRRGAARRQGMQTKAAKREGEFAVADADGDGQLSQAEYRGLPAAVRAERERKRAAAQRERRAGEFAAADADGDGSLSQEEFHGAPAAARAERQRRLFARLDADGDGQLTASEFPSVADRLARLDVNGDGQITQDEMPRRRRR